jgi:hypothetical protein
MDGDGVLRPLVHHARRVTTVLLVCELTPPESGAPAADAARTWLTGRTAEAERFVESVVDDWAKGKLEETAAAASLSAYLDLLHVGLRLHLGVAAPTCCHPSARQRRARRRREPPKPS